MKYEQYTSLISRLEKFAQENPKGYEFRVAALGALGYAYFGGLLLVFLLVPLAGVALLFFMPSLIWVVIKLAGKLIWLILIAFASFAGVIWSFLKSFWAKTPDPEGFELDRAEVPELYKIVDETCDFLKARRPAHILLTEDFNAAVITLTKRGVFGKRTYLLLGLPLMQAISPEQFRAVLAHEIGHISEKHGSSSVWIYNLQESWSRFVQSQEAGGEQLSFLYAKFLNWYFPYFGAYSFVLRRRHEREADAYAVQFVGARPLGEALINAEIKSLNLSKKFWKDVFDETGREPAPPKEFFTRMANAFRETNKAQDLMHLTKAVAVNTGYTDSHPSLSERLKTIGYWNKDEELPVLPEETTETAADLYFGAAQEKYVGIFNALWQERVKADWKTRHDYMLEAQKKIDAFDEKAKSEPLTADELMEQAGLTAERFGDRQALPVLYKVLALDAEHAGANYGVGSILLGDDDERGIEFIERAMNKDRSLKFAGCEAIYYYLRGKGRDEEAKHYILAIESEEEVLGLAQQERAGVTLNDNFAEHDFAPDVIAKIRGKIQYYDEILTAYLAKKVVVHYEEIPYYVLFLDTKKKPLIGGGNMISTEDLINIMSERLGEFEIHFIMIIDKDHKAVLAKLGALENAEIFRR